MKSKKVLYPYILTEMMLKGESRAELAKELKMSTSALSRRLNGEVDWTLTEIKNICVHYNKKPDELFM